MKVTDKTAGEKPQANVGRWEHRTRQMDLNTDLTAESDGGWELVSVVPLPHDPSQGMFFFKRPRK